MTKKSVEEIYQIEDVTKVFGKFYVLNDISFSINAGEIFGIIGSSGSGKTTLLNLLVGFLKPEKGDIKFKNITQLHTNNPHDFRSVLKQQKELKKSYGFAAQSPSFYPNLTVKENLFYFGSLYNLSKETIASNTEHLLELVGLMQAQHLLSKSLSGGMQRRLDIACSLIHNPKILFLDEPTADLDPVLSNKIWNTLRIINQRGTTVILASHNINELEHLCTRIAVLKEGRITAIGDPKVIKSKNLPKESIQLQTSPGNYKQILLILKKITTEEINDSEIKEKRLLIYTNNPTKIVHDLVKVTDELSEKIVNLEFIKPTLDQAFIKMNTETLSKEINESSEKKEKRKKHHKKKHYYKKKKIKNETAKHH